MYGLIENFIYCKIIHKRCTGLSFSHLLENNHAHNHILGYEKEYANNVDTILNVILKVLFHKVENENLFFKANVFEDPQLNENI